MSKMLNEYKIAESMNALNEFQCHIGTSAINANISVKYQDYCPETRETTIIYIGRKQYPFLSIIWEKYEDKFFVDYSTAYVEMKFVEGFLIITGIDREGFKITITVDPKIEE